MNKWKITWHWSAGAGDAITSHAERDAYNYIITRDGKVHMGRFEEEAQIPPLRPGAYAAHTRMNNSWNIGVALSAMHGAVESPFDAGSHPITEAQVTALVNLTADLCRKYDIQVTPRNVCSHAEVPRTRGISQPGKWDITWLPRLSQVESPEIVGDELRRRVLKVLAPATPEEPEEEEEEPAYSGFLADLMHAIKRIFK